MEALYAGSPVCYYETSELIIVARFPIKINAEPMSFRLSKASIDNTLCAVHPNKGDCNEHFEKPDVYPCNPRLISNA